MTLRQRACIGATWSKHGQPSRGLLGHAFAGSAFDEDHKGVLADAVMFHRCSTCFALHDCLESIHVGPPWSDQRGWVRRVDEGANITRYRAEHLAALGGRKPMGDVVDFVGCDQLRHASVLRGSVHWNADQKGRYSMSAFPRDVRVASSQGGPCVPRSAPARRYANPAETCAPEHVRTDGRHRVERTRAIPVIGRGYSGNPRMANVGPAGRRQRRTRGNKPRERVLDGTQTLHRLHR